MASVWVTPTIANVVPAGFSAWTAPSSYTTNKATILTAVNDGYTSPQASLAVNDNTALVGSLHNSPDPMKFQFFPPNLVGKRFLSMTPMLRGMNHNPLVQAHASFEYLLNGVSYGNYNIYSSSAADNFYYTTTAFGAGTGTGFYDTGSTHELAVYFDGRADTMRVLSLRLNYSYAEAPSVSGVAATINQATRVATVTWAYNEDDGRAQYQYKIDAYRVADAVKVVTGTAVTSAAHTGTVTLPVGALDGDYYFQVVVYSNPGNGAPLASTAAISPNVHYAADAVSGAAVSVKTETGVGLPVSYLRLISASGDVKVRSSLKNPAPPLTMATIQDFTFTVKARLVSGAGSIRLVWRASADMTVRYELAITPTALVTKVYPGPTTVNTFTVTTDLNKWYTYKVSTAGSSIAVYRDDGTGAANEGSPQEVARFINTANLAAGHIGFMANTAVGDFTNISVVSQATVAPPVSDPNKPATTFRDPAYNPQGARPTNYVTSTANGQLEYAYLEEEGYNNFYLSPTYGYIYVTDFDLGIGEVRAVAKNRPQNDGTTDHTRYHGPKAVSFSFRVRAVKQIDHRTPRPYGPGAYGVGPYGYSGVSVMLKAAKEIAESVDHLLRWSAPHRRPTLVYKLRGGPEIRLLLRGASLGRATPMTDRLSTLISCQWVAIEGKGYETVEQVVNIVPGNAATTSVITSGTGSTEPTIKAYGPLTNLTIINETLTSRNLPGTLQIIDTIDAGMYYEINCKTRTIYKNGVIDPTASKIAKLAIHDWFSLEPFRNDIRVTTDSGIGTVAIIYRNAHA